MKKAPIQMIWDIVGIPFRLVLFDQDWLGRFGWTTLNAERVGEVLPRVRGKLLDIGAGRNELVSAHGDGVGVDVFDWGNGVIVVEDTAHLPFEDASFDTITLVACLNHIPNRLAVLNEARRLIKSDGRLIVTMISPLLGNLGHVIWWYSEDKKRGGMKEGEVGGMWTSEVVDLCRQAGFGLSEHHRFVYWMNNLYLFKPL